MTIFSHNSKVDKIVFSVSRSAENKRAVCLPETDRTKQTRLFHKQFGECTESRFLAVRAAIFPDVSGEMSVKPPPPPEGRFSVAITSALRRPISALEQWNCYQGRGSPQRNSLRSPFFLLGIHPTF